MSSWVNHVTIAMPRNGTVNNTVNPASSGTVVNGSYFTPTAGNFLVCVVEGGVTATTPAGWTLNTNCSAINLTGLYAFMKTAAGSDTLVTVHNGSNYPVVFDFYEYAAGTTFIKAATVTGANVGSAAPGLATLSGTNVCVMSAVGGAQGSGIGANTTVWTGPTEQVDTNALFSSTDGYTYSAAYQDSFGSATWSGSSVTSGSSAVPSMEKLTWALDVVVGVPNGPAVSTLTDDFVSGIDALKWSTPPSYITAPSGKLLVQGDSSNPLLSTLTVYNLQNDSFTVELNHASTDAESYLRSFFTASTSWQAEGMDMIVTTSGTNLLCRYGTGVANPYSDVNMPFNPNTMRFFRISEKAGNLLWETSPDGKAWTVQRVQPWGLKPNSVTFAFMGYKATTATDITAWDNVNLPVFVPPMAVSTPNRHRRP